jgi:hypothetical protein
VFSADYYACEPTPKVAKLPSNTNICLLKPREGIPRRAFTTPGIILTEPNKETKVLVQKTEGRSKKKGKEDRKRVKRRKTLKEKRRKHKLSEEPLKKVQTNK